MVIYKHAKLTTISPLQICLPPSFKWAKKKKKKFKLQIMVGGGQIGRYCHIVKLLCIFIIIIVLLYKINANRKKKKNTFFSVF